MLRPLHSPTSRKAPAGCSGTRHRPGSPTRGSEPTCCTPRTGPASLETFERVRADGGPFDETYRLRAVDGSWRWLRDVGHATAGERGVVSTIQGILVEATAERSEPDGRFRSVVEHLPAIVYLEELPEGPDAGRMLYVSPQVSDLLGFTQEEWLADPIAWARQLHPEDRDRIRTVYERIETTGEPFRAEYRLFARDGSIRWFRDEAIVVRDTGGAPMYWQGVMFDVTEQHAHARARRRLRRALPHPRGADPRHRLSRGRPAATTSRSSTSTPGSKQLLGITPAEWVEDSSVWMDSIHPDDRERVDAENRQHRGHGRALRDRVPDGRA